MHQLSVSQELLADSLDQLSADWQEAKADWNDAVSQEFEQFWTEFETTTVSSINRLQELIATLAQAEREML